MRYLSTPPGILTTAMAAKAAGVTPAVIRYWVRIGRLTRSGGTPRYPIFRLADVIAARDAARASKAAAAAA